MQLKAKRADLICPLKVNGVVILPGKLDIGVQVNIMSEKDYRRLPGKPKPQPAHERLKGYYQNPDTCDGKMLNHN